MFGPKITPQPSRKVRLRRRGGSASVTPCLVIVSPWQTNGCGVNLSQIRNHKSTPEFAPWCYQTCCESQPLQTTKPHHRFCRGRTGPQRRPAYQHGGSTIRLSLSDSWICQDRCSDGANAMDGGIHGSTEPRFRELFRDPGSHAGKRGSLSNEHGCMALHGKGTRSRSCRCPRSGSSINNLLFIVASLDCRMPE